MSLRVAFDLDGTIADMSSVLRTEADQLFGIAEAAKAVRDVDREAEPADDADDTRLMAMAALRLTAQQQIQLWEHVKTVANFWNGLPEMEPGIVARIAEIAARRRWEVIFLTTRPLVAGDTVQIQSQRWLAAHGFELPSVFVVRRSRGKIADALELDAVVDDRPENCLDVAIDSKAKPILIWPGDPKRVPPGAKRLGVRVAASISEAVALLERMDDRKSDKGVLRSLRKFFGKETTA